ncbi:3-deoxy-D-manno-octulosonic acid transferase [Halomonas litopenaei]|uniref:3-deoxy-D-manno-octulosonic acid transferase n=1 Tax=Halomonas litopenaei TaxID=2109328 RepID=A0ABX5IWR5_9GAMM|nr:MULTISPECIES: lipid IV(A) 3-deoxy-D-manno-octulosonic acid transferase [Halomonas]PTL91493.1 3-deoxy-D-manno-octulosonic acid transferase [Halomonas sp. SYSU XM8]PTL95029.1 3-deoxy-D-manno-octulosonic acid transferase [Halomonas litopenaei]HAR07071.1 3-deoxy-D-manno-octulosonic acid transferase [Cobetia sp.]
MSWPRLAYSGAIGLLSPLIWRRVWREQLPDRARGERMGCLRPFADERPRLWLHCASVGEVVAARPLIRALRLRHPDHRLVVSTMTATGAERVLSLVDDVPEAEAAAPLSHVFVALDFPGAARRFVQRLAPRQAIFFETELWPNLLRACARRGIPVAVVNGRLSPRAFRGYRRLRPLMAESLACVDWLAAKSGEDAERFVELGMASDHIQVVGSMKFDMALDDASLKVSERLHAAIGHRPIWVAGSTHPGEDELLLGVQRRLQARFPDILLVLVPRHPQRFEEVARLCQEAGFETVRRSRGRVPSARAEIYLGDSMGELQALYGTADLAFVGGSLVPIGGHNLLEPALMGVPVVTGPHLDNFEDVAQLLRDAGALVEIADADELVERVAALLEDAEQRKRLSEAGQGVIDTHRGALEATLAGLDRLLGHGQGR